MAKRPKRSTSDVQELLEEKRQVEDWLQRLEMAADKTPEQVRDKVQADYRKRYDAVLEKLRGFRGELQSSLDQQREVREDLAKREAEVSERMAEAELRHAVGEFTEEKWTELRAEILESLVSIREELKAAEDEIGGVEEVIGVVEGADAPAEPEASAAAVLPPEGEPAAEAEPEAEAKAEAEAGAAAEAAADTEPSGEEGPAQTDAFDELEFLRSVTEDQDTSPRRASGAHRPRLSTPDLATPIEQMPALDETGLPTRDSVVGAEGVGPVKEQDRPTRGSAKTVKCGECGAPNLPTEWYCERCGAELAAV
jgi:hypothetical protein